MAIELREKTGTHNDFAPLIGEVIDSVMAKTSRLAFSFSISHEGEVGGLIIIECPAITGNGGLRTATREVEATLHSAMAAIKAVAPALSTRICRGSEIALCGLWGGFDG